jgi:predicted nuclease with RNAse H fold
LIRPMLTLGIDLAAQDKRTAMVRIAWKGGRATVQAPQLGVSDEDALSAMREADCSGVDAPFGWPDAAVKAISGYAEHGVWLARPPDGLRYRLTDTFVQRETRRGPLSVSSDRIAVPAWRCARLLTTLSPRGVNRLGANGVVEVYPGAALSAWGFERGGYKRSGNAAGHARQRVTRECLVEELAKRGKPWLDLSSAAAACIESDDALDAVIAALVTRAWSRGLTHEPQGDLDTIKREGWIQIPVADSFERLACADE